MSKIAEQKALEEYPIAIFPDDDTMGFTSSDRNEVIRFGYIKGYGQAMQDFMEKACYYLKSTLQEDDETNDFIVQQFKNYMQNEM